MYANAELLAVLDLLIAVFGRVNGYLGTIRSVHVDATVGDGS